MKKIEFIIPFFPPSLNKTYTVQRHNHLRRILTKEARQFKENVKSICDDNFDILMEMKRSVKENEIIVVEYIFCTRWINKNGSNKKKDVANFEKLLSDAVMDSMKINDSFIWDMNLKKAHSENKEFILVKISKDKLEKYVEK